MRPRDRAAAFRLALFLCSVPAAVPGAASAQSQEIHPAAQPDSIIGDDAYLDPAARELVRLARERRRHLGGSVAAYETLATERIVISVGEAARERVLWRQEIAARVHWEQDGPTRIEVLGARETGDGGADVGVAGGVSRMAPRLAFDPADRYLLTGWADGYDGVRHPLDVGSERHYRFRSGDSVRLRLGSGEEIRLVELHVLARRGDPELVAGSFWFDADRHDLVRATFRLAADLESDRFGGDDLPAVVRAVLGPRRTTFEQIRVEYGLWDGRWWLPRLFAFRGVATAANAGRAPFTYERSYSDYTVRTREQASAEAPLGEGAGPVAPRTRCPGHTLALLRDGLFGSGQTPPDSLTAAQRAACDRYQVTMAADSMGLVASSDLPPSFGAGETFVTLDELAASRTSLRHATPLPPPASPPRLAGPWNDIGLLRFNRVEGLSVGVRASAGFGAAEATLTGRIGTADLEPGVDLAISPLGPADPWKLRVYRGLASPDRRERPFTPASTLASFLLGGDDFGYYRTAGADLTGSTGRFALGEYEWRLYAQRERGATKGTDLSLPWLLDHGHRLPVVDSSADATQIGGELRTVSSRGRDPVGARAGGELSVGFAVGTFDYARAALTLRSRLPLPGPLLILLEGAAGATLGEPGPQHLWRLGGPLSLRSHRRGALRGDSFWRGRVEIGNHVPAFRVILFAETGWAGSARDSQAASPLSAAGAGLGLLDGLVRLDLARGLGAPADWRVMLYYDGWL